MNFNVICLVSRYSAPSQHLVAPYTCPDHMASPEAPNAVLDDEYDAPIFKAINFPRVLGQPTEPTAPPQVSSGPLDRGYHAPIYRDFSPFRTEPTDAVCMATHQDEGALLPTSLEGRASVPRAPTLYVHTIDGLVINTLTSGLTTEQNAAPLLSPPMPMPPNGPPVTMDQVKEMIQDSVRKAMRLNASSAQKGISRENISKRSIEKTIRI